MALIKNAKGRKDGETDSGYVRLTGNKYLGQLISKYHSAVISSGTELERVLASRLKITKGISIDKINKDKRVFKDAKTDSTGKKHGLIIDCVIEKESKLMLIEIKDGDTFDTKKVAGEIESLIMAKNHILKTRKIKEKDISLHYCSFNARDHKQIEKGAKGLLGECKPMTGKELCKLLGLNFDEILEVRKEHQEENLKYFIGKLKEIPQIKKELKNIKE